MCMWVCTCFSQRVSVYACICVRVCVCVCLFFYVRVFIYVCMSINCFLENMYDTLINLYSWSDLELSFRIIPTDLAWKCIEQWLIKYGNYFLQLNIIHFTRYWYKLDNPSLSFPPHLSFPKSLSCLQPSRYKCNNNVMYNMREKYITFLSILVKKNINLCFYWVLVIHLLGSNKSVRRMPLCSQI